MLVKPYPLKTQHIKWAYTLPGKSGRENALKLFQRVCTMLTTEIIRTDEIGVVFFHETPLSSIKLISADPYAECPDAATFFYPGMSWEPIFQEITTSLLANGIAIGVTALNVLFFGMVQSRVTLLIGT